MHTHQRTPIDGIMDRLHHSRNPLEQQATYLGRTHHQGFPVLHDSTLQLENIHVVGSPGSGKTSRVVQSIARQRIAAGQGAVVVIDGKGDIGLLNSILDAAHRHSRVVKIFTNLMDRSSHGFNPWDYRLIKHLTLVDILGLITNALNLYHGDDYGRAWFSTIARVLLRRAVLERIPGCATQPVLSSRGRRTLFPTEGPIQSFHDLHEAMRELTNDSDEFKAAQHLVFVVESLCDFPQLNIAPNLTPDNPALKHAIFMPDVVRQKQVVYFFLAGGVDQASVSMIAKLALHMLSLAATQHREQYGEVPRVDCICDEAQILIAKNIANILEQARSRGIACTFAHQSMNQLNPPGGPDLRELMMQCSATKILLDARDPWTLDYISRTSGQAKYYGPKYDLPLDNLLRGEVGLQYTAPNRDGQRHVSVSEYVGPKLNSQDILNVSFDPDLCLTWIARAAGLCPFRGWFPMRTEWPVTKAAHDLYQTTPWPETTEEMILPPALWPKDEEDPAAITQVPIKALPQSDKGTDEALKRIWSGKKGS